MVTLKRLLGECGWSVILKMCGPRSSKTDYRGLLFVFFSPAVVLVIATVVSRAVVHTDLSLAPASLATTLANSELANHVNYRLS
jgi:hypothetical protein